MSSNPELLSGEVLPHLVWTDGLVLFSFKRREDFCKPFRETHIDCLALILTRLHEHVFLIV
ncbi:hypothetical protein NITGR_60002 [Nitrospina gracilis 3/211]|uniref:Uncharacterized protein n=1 Tax=Nitrospina gracilis (strain 3/211) TaxID=1266370 RepID=M1Z0I0_NITG3|nr:hypothetical protein NITGR_60002 [Nitrospina gracilis 3/211]